MPRSEQADPERQQDTQLFTTHAKTMKTQKWQHREVIAVRPEVFNFHSIRSVLFAIQKAIKKNKNM